jgi:hypothetical protein
MSVTQFTAARAHLTALWQDLDHEQDTNGTKEHNATLADLLAADKALACHAALVEALEQARDTLTAVGADVCNMAEPGQKPVTIGEIVCAALDAAGVSS